MSNFKRINFRLSKKSADTFTKLSQQSRKLKSKLIREWLEFIAQQGPSFLNSVHSTPLYARQVDWKSFELRLCNEDVYILEQSAHSLNVSQAEIIRRLIKYFSGQHQNVQVHNSSGEIVESILVSLENSKLVQLAIQQTSKGNLKKAQEIIDLLESNLLTKTREHPCLVEVDFLRGTIARHKRELIHSKNVMRLAASRAENTGEASLLAKINSQLGVVEEIADSVPAAIAYQIQSKHFYLAENTGQYDGHLLSTQLRLLGLYATDLNFVKLAEIRNEISLSIESLPSELKVKAMNRLALADIRTGDLASAFQKLDLNYESACRVSQVEKRYSTENLGALSLFSGDYKSAKKMLSEAEKLEMDFRVSQTNLPYFSKNRLYLLFIEAAEDFRQSVGEANQLVEFSHQSIYRGLGRYLIYAMHYLQSGEQAQIAIGRNKLSQLSKSAPNAMLRRAAEMTLKHGVLWPAI